jgi:hypothetical protein
MPLQDSILKQISQTDDTELLRQIITTAKNRLARIEKSGGELHLKISENKWYLHNPVHPSEPIPLCERMNPVKVLERSRQQPPTASKFKIPYKEGERRRQTAERNDIGWYEDPDAPKGHNYYEVVPFQKARAEWRKWQPLAHDPLAVALGLTVKAMEKIRKLEEMGYEIIPPKD